MANSQLPPGSKGTISIPLAQHEVTAWQTYAANTDIVAQSFHFSIDTFDNIKTYTPEADGVRMYLALRAENDPTSITLLLVPTVNGKDIVTLPAPGTVGGDDDTNIYNYAATCPPYCKPPEEWLTNV
ncbi:hypothetical protein [Mucilaginibacter myungsuensis]|uniref:Uncharacterized protein n=1 Tax=Mucilaginibacter myungsuensis TaxID=649104 RepID=A0A929KWT7_9SPHI|nr:hypothetical protein [Mucilaginibacter myungsuensis]MBE9661900.1 hypothetical protein [Mucilaginibacter myungsuensis]MDN3599666.1 hypothetical protein [Mucilaginibacter myungsuensis]